MPLNPPQRRVLEDWMRSKAIVQCPACGDGRWRLAQAVYLRTLLEEKEEDLTEDRGVVKFGPQGVYDLGKEPPGLEGELEGLGDGVAVLVGERGNSESAR